MELDLTNGGTQKFVPGDNIKIIYPGNISRTFICVSCPGRTCSICDVNDGAVFCPLRRFCSPNTVFLLPSKKSFSTKGRHTT